MDEISFLSLTPDYFQLLQQWLQAPHVAKWWGEAKAWSLEDIRLKYTTYTQGYKIHHGEKKGISSFIIQFKQQPVGYIQCYNAFDFPRDGYQMQELWTESSSTLAALDFYIGDSACLGQGLGAAVLKSFLKDHVYSHFCACLVDPDKQNKYAISAYAKAGFTTYMEFDSTIMMIAKKEENKNPLIILGSSRSDGETFQAIKSVIQDQYVPLVDLRKLNISYYDYDSRNRSDDFIPLAEKMMRHNPIILATPVYWYSMSAIMKTFLDRWSDLLDFRKDLGRRLAGKELYVITSYAGEFPKGFEDPFSQTCHYLDMEYKGCFYFYSGEKQGLKERNLVQAKEFASHIWHQTSKEALT